MTRRTVQGRHRPAGRRARGPGATMPTMRLRPSLGLALLLPALYAGPALAADRPPAHQAAAEATEEDEFLVPPPGAPEDQALWQAGRDAGTRIRASRAEASRLQRATRTAKLVERLDAAAKGKPAEEATAIQALRRKLIDQWKENYGIMARRWPVEPTRGCSYAVLHLETAMRAKAAGSTRADVGSARADLKTCTDRANVAIGGMTASNQTFSATLDEAVKRLGELEPRPAGAAAPARPAADAAARPPAAGAK